MEVFVSNIKDTRADLDPLPLQSFLLDTNYVGRYIKLEVLSHYGEAGGLQYFNVKQRGTSAAQFQVI